ncbi:MAG: LacI family DNA-binding transcriptional regulator [Deinococcales bacterium]
MRPTIKDLSKALGLSVSTISKALNGYEDVSPETKELVIKTAKDLGYHPSSIARNLRLKANDKIGIIHPLKSFESEVFVGFFRGLTMAAQKLGYNLVLYTTPFKQADALRNICRSHEVRGMILLGLSLSGMLEETIVILEEEQLPFVVLGHPVKLANTQELNFIASDNRSGVLSAMQHLLAQGHRKIAYIGRAQDRENNYERFLAYQEALNEAGISFRLDLVVDAPYHAYSGREAMKKLLSLEDLPTAVLAFNDHIAVDAAQEVLEKQLRIPQDVAFVGFGDIPYARMSFPPMTTVKVPLREMGEVAVGVLLELTLPPHPNMSKTFPTQLIIRSSS